MSLALRCESLRLRIGEFELRSVSLELGSGGYLVLLGPSGCGKTTLLKTLCGIQRPDEGVVEVDGEEVTDLAPNVRNIGYVPQDATLFPHMKVRDNISFGLRYLHTDEQDRRDRFDRAVQLMRVSQFLDRSCEGLSGGEAKRVSLARSLVLSPSVILLDEPLGMLDPISREELVSALRDIRRETGTATVHVTHDREEAWALGRTCAVMNDGAIEQAGTLQQVFREPATEFVARFTGASNIIPVECERVNGELVGRSAFGILRMNGPECSDRAAIRPEWLQVSQGDGAISAILASVRDRGAFVELEVDAGSERLVAHVPPQQARGLTVGGNLLMRMEGRAFGLPSEEVADA
ncbi:MAG: ABC transporter ATP-binding protein [Planctomycetota bacterium]|nr:ABC transporter ATP-binding protein [Planctomycetota bacterium]